MEKKPINPWLWQEQYGYSQAVEVTNKYDTNRVYKISTF